MAKSVAVLLDGGFVLKKLPKSCTEQDVYQFALSCIDHSTEDLFRIFFYHCMPYEGSTAHPVSQAIIDFKNSNSAKQSRQILSRLSEMNHVAVRKGRVAFRGWTIRQFAVNRLQKQVSKQLTLTSAQTAAASTDNISQTTSSVHQSPISASDFEPVFAQKEVDIKIGLDVAWMSSRRIVDKIILVTGDTDFVPAMKFARREGVQVVIVDISFTTNRKKDYLKGPLKEHADEVRKLTYENGNWSITR